MYAIRSYYVSNLFAFNLSLDIFSFTFPVKVEIPFWSSASNFFASIINRNNFVQHTLYEVIRIESKKDLENIIVSYNFGTPTYLKDVANISRSYDIQNKKSAYIYTKDHPSGIEQVTLSVSKLKGSYNFV